MRSTYRMLGFVVLVIACKKPADESRPHDDPPPGAAVTPGSAAKHEDRHEPATGAPALTLDVTIDGAKATWQRDAFDKVPHLIGKNNDGEARDVWSLRELAHQIVGPNARVVAITGADATKPITPEAWADATRIPILHTTRRGTLKFRWTDTDGKWGDTEVKDVAKLEIVR